MIRLWQATDTAGLSGLITLDDNWESPEIYFANHPTAVSFQKEDNKIEVFYDVTAFDKYHPHDELDGIDFHGNRDKRNRVYIPVTTDELHDHVYRALTDLVGKLFDQRIQQNK